MHFKRGFIVLVVAGFVAGVSLSGCVLPVKPPVKDNPKPSASVSAGAKAPAELEGAVEIEGAFGDGSMWAKVGPVYRLDSGVSALALTAGFSKEVTRYPSTSSVGLAIVTPYCISNTRTYSGIFVLNDTEVFEPLAGDDHGVLWVPQDTTQDKNNMHSFEEKKRGGLQESVLVPFGDVGADTKTVGVSVGLIGFAPDVPVVDGSKAPKQLASALKQLPGNLEDVERNIHSEYSEFTNVPGMDVISSDKSLDVTLAADVFFDSGKWDLKPESQSTLDEVAKAVSTHEKGEVSIVGHTDNVPDRIVGNQVLSENRANAVKTVLEGKSELAGFTFVASGKGETEPVAPNDTDENKAKNRRVQVSIKSPVKKEILELQAVNAEKPPAAGQESTWPEPVLYDSNKGGGEKWVWEIGASEATAFDNYTLVTFRVKVITGKLWATAMNVGRNPHGDEGTGGVYPGFYGGNILRGQARTSPLEYIRPWGFGDKSVHAVIAGANISTAPSTEQPNDMVTIPVLYPPTKDKTITIDAVEKIGTTGEQYGWRINDIPVKPAKSVKS